MPRAFSHSFDVSPKEAILIQESLSKHLILKDAFKRIETIAGVDVALTGGYGIAGVVIFSYPALEEIGREWISGKITFPYIPGLLSFREGPLILKLFEKLKKLPDLIVFDGQGIAHPRRFGIASHMGLLLKRPTIGCAKSHLFGSFTEPGLTRGSFSYIMDGRKKIGACLRTRSHVRPIFISPGHKISLKTSIRIIMKAADGFRIPKPTREADHFVEYIKRL